MQPKPLDLQERFRFGMHQILHSVGILRGYFELYCQEGDDEYKDHLREEIAYLGQLSQELMLFEKVSSGQTAEQVRAFDMVNLLEVILHHFQMTYPERFFQTKGFPDALMLNGHRFYVEEILRILVHNACLHSPNEAKITLTIDTSSDQLHFTIRNEGSGIPQKEQKNIFQPFYSLSKSKHSTGMGLSILRRLTDLESIGLTLDSDGESYTEFALTFPASYTS